MENETGSVRVSIALLLSYVDCSCAPGDHACGGHNAIVINEVDLRQIGRDASAVDRLAEPQMLVVKKDLSIINRRRQRSKSRLQRALALVANLIKSSGRFKKEVVTRHVAKPAAIVRLA